MEVFTDFMAMIGVWITLWILFGSIVTLYQKIAKWGKHHVRQLPKP